MCASFCRREGVGLIEFEGFLDVGTEPWTKPGELLTWLRGGTIEELHMNGTY